MFVLAPLAAVRAPPDPLLFPDVLNSLSPPAADVFHDQRRLHGQWLASRNFSVTWVKPFDPLARGSANEGWLGVRDDFRNWLIRAA